MKRGIIIISQIFIGIFIKIIDLNHIKKIVIIFPFLLSGYRYITPNKYEQLKSIITINKADVEMLRPVIDTIFNILIHINFMVIQVLVVLTICFMIQWCAARVGRLVGIYISRDNIMTKGFYKCFFSVYIRMGILLYTIAIYSEMLLDISWLLDMANKGSAFWVSGFPFKFIGSILIFGLIMVPVPVPVKTPK